MNTRLRLSDDFLSFIARYLRQAKVLEDGEFLDGVIERIHGTLQIAVYGRETLAAALPDSENEKTAVIG